jgi:hypothetical protein
MIAGGIGIFGGRVFKSRRSANTMGHVGSPSPFRVRGNCFRVSALSSVSLSPFRHIPHGLSSPELGPFLFNVGVKEIERLIKKLELDKEILADQEDEEVAN